MNKKVRMILTIMILVCLTVPLTSGLAQKTEETKVIPQALEEAIQAKLDDLQKRIKIFSEAEREDVAKGLNVTLDQLRERTEILQETKTFNTQQLNAIRKYESLLQEKEALNEKIATGEALEIEESPPYSLKFHDYFHHKLSESKRNRETARLAVSVAEKALQDARDRYQKASAQTRSLKEELGKEQDTQEVLAVQWLLEQSEREVGLTEALVGYQKWVQANAREEIELFGIRSDLYLQISEGILENLHFDPADLETQLALIDEQKKELQGMVDEVRKDLRQANRIQTRAQRKVEKASEEKELSKAKLNLIVAEQWRQTYQVKLEQVESSLQQMNTRKQLWRQRYDLIKGEIPWEDLAGLKEGAVKLRERQRQRISLEQERQTNLQLQIAKLEDQLQQEGLSWDAKSNLNEQRKAQVGLVGSTINFITTLNHTSQMNLLFIAELERALKVYSFEQTVKIVVAKLKGWWQAELYVVDDQSLTVSKIIIALVILILGVIITGIMSRLLQRSLQHQFKVNASSAAITSKLVHYAVLLLVVLFVMRTVNIPLTAFTFLGGAIAIGVGFGAQKLINNFISCFIIMAEQPIRVGDLIMMDNELGWIEDIGARCTRVRTYSNIRILVPNSYFLENNIINWTLNDNIVRGQVTVGVAYGSPTREVKEALLKAAAGHGEVHNNPAPYVWFGDFGENALVFELYYWVTVTEGVSIERTSSDLRFMIDHLFREAGIQVAFPQRDLHFTGDRPLQIEVSRAKPGTAES
jgi:potassium efflux system protein